MKKGIKFHNSSVLNVILFFKKSELLKFLVNWKKQNVYNVFNRLLNVFALFHFRRSIQNGTCVFANTYLLCVAFIKCFIDFFCDLIFTYGI